MNMVKHSCGAVVNGHSKKWFSSYKNRRGKIVAELIDDFHLEVANKPGKPETYCRSEMGSSNIDVTIITTGIAEYIENWNVTEVTDSDHRAIEYSLKLITVRTIKSDSRIRLNTEKADWDSFKATLIRKLNMLTQTTNINEKSGELQRIIVESAMEKIPRKRVSNKISRPFWWNENCAISKAELSTARRMNIEKTDWEKYKTLRNTHLNNIRAAKRESWRNFIDEVNV